MTAYKRAMRWTIHLRAAAIATTIVIVVAAASWWAARRAEAAHRWRPRITILMALDTLRADRLGCYGYARPTSPFLDQVAREGVLFENAFSQANNTRQSFLQTLTGRFLLSAASPRVPDDLPTLASSFSSYGYRTGGFVGGGQLDHVFGFDRGFDVYDDHCPFGSFFHSVPKAIDWLKTAGADGGRCFLFVHGYDAHSPYYKPLGYEGLYDPGYQGVADVLSRTGGGITMIEDDQFYRDHFVEALRDGRPPSKASDLRRAGIKGLPLADSDRRHLSATYDSAISYADVMVGHFMAALHDLGLEKETLLVVMGDHGEEMFEAGRVGHGLELNDLELHVPLLVWAPSALRGGARLADVVSLVDVMPTLLDFSTIPCDGVAGVSLKPLLVDGDRRGLPQVSVAFGPPHAAIRDARHRLVVAVGSGGGLTADTPPDDPEAGLFAPRLDPAQRHDLIHASPPQGTVAGLRAQLDAQMRRPHL